MHCINVGFCVAPFSLTIKTSFTSRCSDEVKKLFDYFPDHDRVYCGPRSTDSPVSFVKYQNLTGSCHFPTVQISHFSKMTPGHGFDVVNIYVFFHCSCSKCGTEYSVDEMERLPDDALNRKHAQVSLVTVLDDMIKVHFFVNRNSFNAFVLIIFHFFMFIFYRQTQDVGL